MVIYYCWGFYLSLLLAKICQGQMGSDGTEDIASAGSTDADPTEFPFMVRIVANFPTLSNNASCSGALIHPGFVLTNAHCLRAFNVQTNRSENARSVTMVFGREPNEVYATSSRAYIHPNFTVTAACTNGNFDVAVIRLARRLPETQFVRAIPLPIEDDCYKPMFFDETSTRVDECSRGIAVNWEGTGFIKKAVANVEEFTFCQQGGLDTVASFSDSKFCIRGAGIGPGPCTDQFNEANPLLCFNSEANQFVLNGLSVAFSPNTCATAARDLNVYLRVCRVLPWIRSYVPPLTLARQGPNALPSGIALCGILPTIENGRVVEDSSDFSVGAIRFIQCSAGHRLVGANIIACVGYGLWSQPGVCRPIPTTPTTSTTTIPTTTTLGNNCLLPNIPGARFSLLEDDGSENEIREENAIIAANQEISIACRDGFSFRGNRNSVCLPWTRTVWRPLPGTCISTTTTTRRPVQCGLLPSFANGLYEGDTTFNVGDTRNLRCGIGYRLTGDRSITCLSNGTWTLPGTCSLITCGSLPTVANGFIESGENVVGTSRIIRCNEGFGLSSGTPNQTLCGLSGQWSEVGRCVPIRCGPPPLTIDNGYVEPSDGDATTFDIGTTRSLICNYGYQLPGSGPTNIRCQTNGQWSRPVACEQVNCQGVPSIPNGRIETNGTANFGATRAVSCSPGFLLLGSNEVTCRSDGSWSQPGTCARVFATPASLTGSTTPMVLTSRQSGSPRSTREVSPELQNQLFQASANGSVEQVRRLLEQGAEINAKDSRSNGMTPLIWAAYYGHDNVVRLLMDRGADINGRADDGNTALTWASYWGHIDSVRLLGDRGANLELRLAANSNYPGHTALMMAAYSNKPGIVRYLLSKGASRSGCTYLLCQTQ